MKKLSSIILFMFCFSAFAEPTILEFYATWCPPCNRIAPIVEKVSKDMNISLRKIDIDKNRPTVKEFNITSIPALVVIKDGKVVGKIVGFKEEDELKEALNEMLNSK